MKKADRTKKGMIFNIQKFSVNDGPGIRTVVFFKGCPLHCAWCANPESQYSEMQVLWNMEKCVRCHHCMEICPKKAITFFSNEIKINPYICNGCQKCIEECPARALQAEGEEKTVQGVLDVVLQDKVFYEESRWWNYSVWWRNVISARLCITASFSCKRRRTAYLLRNDRISENRAVC